jgi:hypothetical protein
VSGLLEQAACSPWMALSSGLVTVKQKYADNSQIKNVSNVMEVNATHYDAPMNV